MKQLTFGILVLVIGFFWFINMQVACRLNQDLEKVSNRVDYIDSVLLYRDSLHREHMSKCSFISVEQVHTDKNGYLKLKKVPRSINK